MKNINLPSWIRAEKQKVQIKHTKTVKPSQKVRTALMWLSLLVISATAKAQITTNAVSSPICAGTSVTISFTVFNAFSAGTTFRAQLSTPTGGFPFVPMVIGSKMITTGLSAGSTSTINCVIPGIASGTAYRIRVISVSPSVTGFPNTSNIVINPKPTVSLSSLSPSSICFGVSPFPYLLSGGTPSGGAYSGPMGVSGGSFSPPGQGTFPITYTFTDANGCTNSATNNIQVHPLPVVTIGTYANRCSYDPPVSLSGSPAGGYFQGNGVTNGTFDPAAVTPGTHTIIYRYTDANGCFASAQTDITVYAAPTVTLGTFNDICEDATPLVLSVGSPAGGTYYLNGNAITSFDPKAAGPGQHTITYKYTNANGCWSSAPSNITVLPGLASISGVPTSGGVCSDAMPIPLTGTPAGGIFSGTGLFNGNEFDPYMLPVGVTYTITYSYTFPNGCVSNPSEDITVFEAPVANFNYSDACQNATGQSSFINTSTISTGISSLTFDWNIDYLGITFQTQDVTYPYPAVAWTGPNYYDKYDVELMVTTVDGCISTMVLPVKIYQHPPAPALSAGTSMDGCFNGTYLEAVQPGGVMYKWYDGSGNFVGTGDTYVTPPLSGSTPIYYSVQSFSNNAGACSSTLAPVVISINNLQNPPAAPLTGLVNNLDKICPTGSTDMYYTHPGSNNPTAFSFQWYMDGVLIPGATGSPHTFSPGSGYSWPTSEDFTVTVKESGTGCRATSFPLTVEVLPAVVETLSPTDFTCPGQHYPYAGLVTNQTYDWYFDAPGPGPVIQVCDDCTRFQSFPSDAEGEYYYIATSPAGCMATSGIHTLEVLDEPMITYPGSPGPAVFTPGSSLLLTAATTPGFQVIKYTWYKNGDVLAACSQCSTRTVSSTGIYEVEVDYGCSTTFFSEPLEVRSNCTNSTYVTHSNTNFSSGTTLTSGSGVNGFTFDGTVTITGGSTLNISNTTVQITPCTEIIVEAGSTLNITNSSLLGCGQWAGIKVEAIGTKRGVVNITNGTITGAVIGIYSPNGGEIDATGTKFVNNVTHVAMFDYAGVNHGSVLTDNTFGYLWHTATSCSPQATFNKPTIAKMVYLEEVQGISLVDNGFSGHIQHKGTFSKTCLEMHDVSQINIYGNSFKGDLDYGLDIENSDNITIGGGSALTNNFSYGNINTGVSISETQFVTMTFNNFGNTSSRDLINGAIFKDVEALYTDYNTFNKMVIGMQYYMSYNYSSASLIQRNLFKHCTTGLVIAQQEHPRFTLSGNGPANYLLNLDLHCNKFHDNISGIIGSGVIPPQGDPVTESANDFDGNIEYDVVWDVNSGTPIFYQYNGVAAINANTANPIYTLNGFMTNGNVTTGTCTTRVCRGSWKTEPVTVVEEIPVVWSANVYPNPSGGELNVKFNAVAGEKYQITMFDMLGRTVMNETVTASDGENIFNFNNPSLKKGIYILHLNSAQHSAHFRVLMNTKDRD
jgi:hypothetical protein